MSKVNQVSVEGNIVRDITFNDKGNAIMTIVQSQFKPKEGAEGEWEKTREDFYSVNIFNKEIIASVQDQMKKGQTVIANCKLSTYTPTGARFPQMTLVLKSIEIVERKAPAPKEEAPAPAEQKKPATKKKKAATKKKETAKA